MQFAKTIATSTTAQNLRTALDISVERFDYLLLQAPVANTTNVLYGSPGGEIFHLEPGDKILLPPGNTKSWSIKAASGTPSLNVGII